MLVSPLKRRMAFSQAGWTRQSSSWRSGDRAVVCIAYKPTSADPGSAPITGSIQNSGQ
jgi:hypothetical protein